MLKPYICSLTASRITAVQRWRPFQSSWLQIQKARVEFQVLPDFLRSRGSETEPTQPREDNVGATYMQVSGQVQKTEIMVVGIRCGDHGTPTNFADKWQPLCRYS